MRKKKNQQDQINRVHQNILWSEFASHSTFWGNCSYLKSKDIFWMRYILEFTSLVLLQAFGTQQGKSSLCRNAELTLGTIYIDFSC